MKPGLFIAKRLFSSSRKGLSGGVTHIAVLSIAIGVAVMIASVAIVIGFKQQIRDKVIGFAAHIQIESLDNNSSWEVRPIHDTPAFLENLKHLSEIEHIQRVANKAGMIKTDDQIQGIILKGVGQDYNWSYMEDKIFAGHLPQYTDAERSEEVMISRILAEKLLLGVDDRLRVWFIGREDARIRGRNFRIAAIYETGLTEFDERFVFGHIGHVQRLNSWQNDQIGHFEVQISNMRKLSEITHEIYYALPYNLVAYNARESYPHIFDWLDLQDMNVIVIIILMILVAGITMISTLLIIILERTSMIGILKALGSTNKLVRHIFLWHALAILVRGLIWGNAMGIGFCLLQLYTGIIKLPADSYYLSEVPIYLNGLHILLINAGTIAVWFLMMLIPTAVISRITPAKAIRYA